MVAVYIRGLDCGCGGEQEALQVLSLNRSGLKPRGPKPAPLGQDRQAKAKRARVCIPRVRWRDKLGLRGPKA